MFKPRSKFGKHVDEHLGYGGQEKIRKETQLHKDTISKSCNESDYKPPKSIQKLLIIAFNKLTNNNVSESDFW